MRTTAACPKCAGTKILVAELRYITGESGTVAVPIKAVAWTTRGFMGAASGEGVGRFESWICAGCGYTELYAEDLGDIDELAAEHPDEMRIVDATVPAKGPFR